eukprot:2850124-Heterocapsa_arctica.AAC.1
MPKTLSRLTPTWTARAATKAAQCCACWPRRRPPERCLARATQGLALPPAAWRGGQASAAIGFLRPAGHKS